MPVGNHQFHGETTQGGSLIREMRARAASVSIEKTGPYYAIGAC